MKMGLMGRIAPGSSTLKVTGGNESAESVWGVAKSALVQRGAHRGGAAQHATSHALCASFLARTPGVAAAGAAWRMWFDHHLDSGEPKNMFSSSGWTGQGAQGDDAKFLKPPVARPAAAKAKARASAKPPAARKRPARQQ